MGATGLREALKDLGKELYILAGHLFRLTGLIVVLVVLIKVIINVV